MQAGYAKCRCCGGQQPVFVHRESGPCPSPHPPTSGSAPTRMCIMCAFRPPVTWFAYFKRGNLTLLHSRTIGNPIKRFFDVVRNKTPWHWKQSRSVEDIGARACQRPVAESLDTGCFSCRLLELYFWGRALALLKAVFLWRNYVTPFLLSLPIWFSPYSTLSRYRLQRKLSVIQRICIGHLWFATWGLSAGAVERPREGSALAHKAKFLFLLFNNCYPLNL